MRVSIRDLQSIQGMKDIYGAGQIEGSFIVTTLETV